MNKPLASAHCFAIVLAGVLEQRTASAQSAEEDDGPAREQVVVEDVLHPRAGRARLEITSETGAPIAVGLASERPERREPGVRFGVERTPVLCSAPCNLFLRPGIQRLVAESDTPYVWSADLALATAGSRYAIRPHRVGFSAIGGALFVVGCAGAVLGPGVVVVNLLVGDRAQLPLAIAGGSIAAAVGAGLIVGGWFTVRAGAPRITELSLGAGTLTARGVF
jgi:hypothetical protein